MISGNYSSPYTQINPLTPISYQLKPTKTCFELEKENYKLKTDQKFSNFYILSMASISVASGAIALIGQKILKAPVTIK